MTQAAKETKAQRVERLKREKNPLESLRRDPQLRAQGFASIPPEWLGTYFRWWGVYTQGDGAGAVGGSKAKARRCRTSWCASASPTGSCSSQQLAHHRRAYAELRARRRRHHRRQNIQLHWVTIEALPELLERLWRSGLTTMGACGDVTRNITGCPLAGVDADEICDASPLVREADTSSWWQPGVLQPAAQIQDLHHRLPGLVLVSGDQRRWLTAVRARRNGKSEIGFSLRVGGGLSTDPHLACG